MTHDTPSPLAGRRIRTAATAARSPILAAYLPARIAEWRGEA
ncbi:hypothetical protein [Nocardioides sp. cx-169]|nr:hypothetical protein [Nocardioides sp. cx-169]